MATNTKGTLKYRKIQRTPVVGEVFSSLVPLRLKPSGSVFWKEDVHSTAYSKSEEGSGCYKEK